MSTAERLRPLKPDLGGNQATPEWLPLSKLIIDYRYQRPKDEGWIERKAKDPDLGLLGSIEVSARPDGNYAVMDGQHRMWLLRRVGFEDELVLCNVHTGLTLAEEAWMFHELNKERRAVKSVNLWMARATAEEPLAVAITAILAHHGLEVGPTTERNKVSAVSSLERIATSASLQILDRTLEVVIGAWGINQYANNGDLLLGVALFLQRYGQRIDLERLVHILAGQDPTRVLGNARSRKAWQGGKVFTNVAAVLTEALYNKGLRRNRLTEWEERTKNVWRPL